MPNKKILRIMMMITNATVKAWHLLLIIGLLGVFIGLYMFVFIKNEEIMMPGVFFIIGGLSIIVFTLFNYQSVFDWIWYLVYGTLMCGIGYYMATYTGDSPFFVLSGATLFVSVILIGIGYDLSKAGVPGWKGMIKSCVVGVLFSLLSFAEPVFIVLSIVTIGISMILLSLEFRNMNLINRRINKRMIKL
ncbi:hypothetical protein VO54_03674 [Elizabethkingia miricola]|nr:hypothetical protein VO54_03674 [Elizabethkingia miricola]